MEIAIVFVAGLLALPLIAWAGRRSGNQAIQRLGIQPPGTVSVVAFMTGAALTPLRSLDPAVPVFSALADRLLRGRVLIAIADHRDVSFWRSGRDPQALTRIPIARLQNATAVPEGLTIAMHLALTFADGAGRPVTVPLVAHGASGVSGRPTSIDLQRVASAILSLRTSR